MWDRQGPQAVTGLTGSIGPGIRVGTLAEAAEPEIVILATAWLEAGDVLAGVADWEGRILVDATNPQGAAGETAARLSAATSSEAVERMAPGAHLVKAFNTLSAARLAEDPRTPAGRRVVFLAGDNGRARSSVRRLVERMDFAVIDLGPLRIGGALMDVRGGSLFGENLLRTGP
jgi:predicted dinucleotide-binding enzyme